VADATDATDATDAIAAQELLADRSRARLFALLADRARPATTSELAETMQLHPNGVRRHLGALQAAGLVTRAHTEGGRGRPADTWMAVPGTAAGPHAASAYRELARWLARAIAGGATDPDAIRAVGRVIGRELAADEEADDEEAEHGLDDGALAGALASMGFAPQPMATTNGRTALRLDNCPYCDAVRENQPAICGLHRGITEGLLDVLAPEAELTRFVAEDPRSAGCLIEITEPTEGG
jgi:predicted ArsR family transcriptional regulator